jgi:hypothetical protein
MMNLWLCVPRSSALYSGNDKGFGMYRSIVGMLVFVIGILYAPSLVSAHGLVAGGSSVIEVDAGMHQLRIEAIVPTGAPTTLTLKILPDSPLVGAGIVTVAARSLSGVRVAPQVVSIPAGLVTIAVVDIPITSTGAWDIEVIIDDDQRQPGVVLVPVMIQSAEVPLATVPLFFGFGLIALVLTVQVLWLAAPAWVGMVSRTLMVASLTFVGALGLVSVSPQVRLEWNTPLPQPMPFISQQVTMTDTDILFRLYDGSTGLPVDDVVPHHNALMHTVCIDDGNNALVHVHPARSAAGVFVLSRQHIPPGTYTCSIETERMSVDLSVPGNDIQLPAPGALDVPQFIDGYDVQVQAEQRILAGVPVSLKLSIERAGVPIEGIQPWLGMRGHLIVRSVDTQLYGHVHAAGTMDEAFQPATQPGHTVTFVYAFPQPGSYTLWFQVRIDGNILTIPVTVRAEGA